METTEPTQLILQKIQLGLDSMVSPLSSLRIPTLYIPLLWIYQIDIPFALRMSNRLVAPLHLKGMLLDDVAIKVLEMLKHLLHHPLMLLPLQLLLSHPLQSILHSHHNQNELSPEDLPVEAEVNRPEFHL